jgi:hypothetical protein
MEARKHRAAGRRPGVGDRVVARADGPGRIIGERDDDVIDDVAGALAGTWEADELADLRDEWD